MARSNSLGIKYKCKYKQDYSEMSREMSRMSRMTHHYFSVCGIGYLYPHTKRENFKVESNRHTNNNNLYRNRRTFFDLAPS